MAIHNNHIISLIQPTQFTFFSEYFSVVILRIKFITYIINVSNDVFLGAQVDFAYLHTKNVNDLFSNRGIA